MSEGGVTPVEVGAGRRNYVDIDIDAGEWWCYNCDGADVMD